MKTYEQAVLKEDYRGRKAGEKARVLGPSYINDVTMVTGSLLWFADGENIIVPEFIFKVVPCPHTNVLPPGAMTRCEAGEEHDVSGRCQDCNEVVVK